MIFYLKELNFAVGVKNRVDYDMYFVDTHHVMGNVVRTVPL